MSNKSDISTNNGTAVGVNNGEINIQNGLTLEGLRPYIEEVVCSEIEKYKNKALETARLRDGEFVVSVFDKLNKLETKIEKVQEALSSPSMQFDLLEAERGYIKTGSQSLLNILGELIAERVNCNEATIKQIVLSEAIKTAPILLDKQLDILALRFIISRTSLPGTRTLKQLISFLKEDVLPFCSRVNKIDRVDFEHLDYTRCSIKSVMSTSLYTILWHNYTSAFYVPFSSDLLKMELINGKNLYEWYPEVFINDGINTLTFRKNNYSEFSNQLNERKDIPESVKNKMITFYKTHCIEEKKAFDYLLKNAPELEPINEMWDKGVSSIVLSSIGLAIGAIHIKNNVNSYIDLDIWIH